LISEGRNGFTFNPKSIYELINKLKEAIIKVEKGGVKREVIFNSVCECNIENYVNVFYNAIQYVMRGEKYEL